MTTTTIPPRVITADEYETQWKPKGWELIIIGPTSTWREEWGEWEAIRDIVQNALDECEQYTWGYDSEGLYISDTGEGIGLADFLLGPKKLKSDYARGKYGEGMKVAALALLRKGYSVRVETRDRVLWMIFLEQKINGGVQTLAALWKASGKQYTGTTFHLIGYFGTAYEDRFAVNLPRNAIIAEGPSRLHKPIRRYNQLIKDSFQNNAGSEKVSTSRIYGRDIYMKEINSPYSYNLWSFEMAPDRMSENP